MRQFSRRALLAGGIGVAAAAAAGGYGLVEAGALPGKYRLAEALGQCGAMPAPATGPPPVQQEATFWSAYRRRVVRMVTLLPPGARAASGRALGVVVALHGLGGDALAAASLYGPAMTRAGVTRFAVVAADGGDTYWHKRADGDDPLGMIIHEVLPRAAARGLAVAAIGIIGYSMGGYGAVLLAERLGGGPGRPSGPPAAAAVAAASPAIFASYQDAVAADAQAFASPAEFAANNVLAPAGVARLRGVPAWVACGGTDPFAAASELLRGRLSRLAGRPAAGGIESGCHDEAFWARTAPSGLAFLGPHLGPAGGLGAATG